nr:MAG TPA: hypothetical protein [Microviridae sp.]
MSIRRGLTGKSYVEYIRPIREHVEAVGRHNTRSTQRVCACARFACVRMRDRFASVCSPLPHKLNL